MARKFRHWFTSILSDLFFYVAPYYTHFIFSKCIRFHFIINNEHFIYSHEDNPLVGSKRTRLETGLLWNQSFVFGISFQEINFSQKESWVVNTTSYYWRVIYLGLFTSTVSLFGKFLSYIRLKCFKTKLLTSKLKIGVNFWTPCTALSSNR